jgi:1-acyl-sn-glycerol-3-phosphate acyltransferase
MFYLRVFALLIWVISISILFTVYAVLRWGNFNINQEYARIYSWGAKYLLGLKVNAQGVEHLNQYASCIYAANHQSNLDTVVFGGIYPNRTVVIGKKEVKWIPFFGQFFVAAGNFTLDRANKKKALAGLAKAVSIMKSKQVCIWIFPEGTRNKKGEGLLPFKKGAFHMAIQAQVPIIPMISAPLRPFINWEARKITPGTIQIRVLPPIHTQGMTTADVEKLSEQTRLVMLNALSSLKS